MKTIKIRFIGNGKRTMDTHMSGFVGPAKKPMGQIPMKDAGDYIKPGEITSIFRLTIPPNGICEVVDVQHNRERLRILTKGRDIYEDVKVFDQMTGQYHQERQKIHLPAAFEVLDKTPIQEDIPDQPKQYDTKEVKALKAKIAKLEADAKGEKVKDPPPDVAPDEPPVPLEEDPDIEDEKPLTGEALKKARFANKKPDPVSLV